MMTNIRLRALCPFIFALLTSVAVASPHGVQKRDFFSDLASDIVNVFDTIEMCVQMAIFTPVENFFTALPAVVDQFVVMPAQDFFMQANTVVIGGLYDITMLTNDIANAVNNDIIDAATSVENFAVNAAQTISTADTTLNSQIANEFNNVITPALASVGDEIGQALAVPEADILTGLEAAGTFIQNHPELVGNILLSVAVAAVSIAQPELIGADAALIGDIASEVGADAASEALTSLTEDTLMEGVTGEILDGGADMVVMQTDKSLFEMISAKLNTWEKSFTNLNRILNAANYINDTLADLNDIFPMSGDTFMNLEAAIAPLQAATSGAASVYGNFAATISALNSLGKIVVITGAAKRDEWDAILEQRAKVKTVTTSSKTSSSSSSSTKHSSSSSSSGKSSSSSSVKTTSSTIKTSSTTKPSSSTAKTSSTTNPSSSTAKTSSTTKPFSSTAKTSSGTLISSSTSKPRTTSTSATSTASATPSYLSIDMANLTQFVQHHWLNSTIGGTAYVKSVLRNSLMAQLSSSNATAASLKSSSMLPGVITNMTNSSVVYPPSTSSYNMAIAHQIAMGNATAYNAQNLTVKIQMNPNAPVDPCLNITDVGQTQQMCSFGNQANLPFCKNQCYSRWYNQMVPPITVAQ